MSSTKKALFNTGWLFSEKIVSLGITFLLNIFLARYLAPEGYGQYNFVAAFVGLLGPFTSVGLNAIVTREIVNGISHYKVLGTSITLRLLGGVVGAFLTFLLLSCLVLLKTDLIVAHKWLVFAAIANIFSALYVLEYYFNAKVASKYCVIVRVGTLMISTSAKLIGLYFSYSIEFFLWVMLVEVVIRASLFVAIYGYYQRVKDKEQEGYQFDVDWRYGGQLLKQSSWLLLSGFMSIIYLKIDQLMLGSIDGARAVGTYAVAAKLSEVWYFFPVAITTSFFPKLLKVRENKTAYTQQLEKLCGVLLWMAVVIALAVTLVSEVFITYVFGETYRDSAPILDIHIWAGTFIFVRALFSKWLIAEGLLKFSLLTHGVAAVVNVALNLVLIPEYSGMGAAIATLISYGVSSYFTLWLHPKTRPMAIIMTKSIAFPITLIGKRNNPNLKTGV